jgi:hypothetical protein
MSQKPGFLSQNAGLRDAPRPYVRGSGTRQLFAPSLESLMSRRQLSLVVVTIASLIVTACASPTAPQAAPKAGKASFDATTDSTGRIGTLGSG